MFVKKKEKLASPNKRKGNHVFLWIFSIPCYCLTVFSFLGYKVKEINRFQVRRQNKDSSSLKLEEMFARAVETMIKENVCELLMPTIAKSENLKQYLSWGRGFALTLMLQKLKGGEATFLSSDWGWNQVRVHRSWGGEERGSWTASGNLCTLSKRSSMLLIDAFLQGGVDNFQGILKIPGLSIR